MGAPISAEEFDPFDMSQPDVAWRELREQSPVFYHQRTGYWVVTQYDDIKAVYTVFHRCNWPPVRLRTIWITFLLECRRVW